LTTRRLIVFDLDGTLVDSRLDLAESANELLERYGARPLPVDRVTGMVGEGARVLVERVLAAGGLDAHRAGALEEFLEIYDRRLTQHTRLYPGVEGALHALHGRAALAILTNKPGHHTRRLLEALGVSTLFDEVIGGDSAFPRKPDPAALLHLVRQFGTTVEDTVLVGDSMVDVETGRRAGVRICVAAYGFARYREGIALRGDELVAPEPADVGPRLEQFLDG
jgi:phosphoglycolate phosphatase